MSDPDPPGSASEAWPSGLRPAPGAGSPVAQPPQPGATEPFRSVGFTLSSLGYAVARGFSQALAPLGIEPRDFALLRLLATAEGDSQQAIGERLGIPSSRMVAVLDAHEARGLIERRQDQSDRRIHALHLTADGGVLLARAFAIAVAYEQELCGNLSADEREQLLDLLQRVGVRLGVQPGVHAAQADDGPHGEQ
jgi:DNA-binding MarR family transcriptional regulator